MYMGKLDLPMYLVILIYKKKKLPSILQGAIFKDAEIAKLNKRITPSRISTQSKRSSKKVIDSQKHHFTANIYSEKRRLPRAFMSENSNSYDHYQNIRKANRSDAFTSKFKSQSRRDEARSMNKTGGFQKKMLTSFVAYKSIDRPIGTKTDSLRGIMSRDTLMSKLRLPGRQLAPSSTKASNFLSEAFIPKLPSPKLSSSSYRLIASYAVNTSKGMIRDSNQDRVSIILNIIKPANKVCRKWPNCSFFGVFDGHGGTKCSDFLRDHLHKFVVQEPTFPDDVEIAILEGFRKCENSFLETVQENNGDLDISGSCAIVLIVVEDLIYIVNLGDSRAIFSQKNGEIIGELSSDHKPEKRSEKLRIENAGGRIYKSQDQDVSKIFPNIYKQPYVVNGPWRIFPGKLSVSRSFGDILAKNPKFGGNPNILIAKPEITTREITSDLDFIVLACDGIFDVMSTKDVTSFVWDTIKSKGDDSIHTLSGRVVNSLLVESMRRKSLDNVTAIFISFPLIAKYLDTRSNRLGNAAPNYHALNNR